MGRRFDPDRAHFHHAILKTKNSVQRNIDYSYESKVLKILKTLKIKELLVQSLKAVIKSTLYEYITALRILIFKLI